MECCKTKSLILTPSSNTLIKYKESAYIDGNIFYWYDDLKHIPASVFSDSVMAQKKLINPTSIIANIRTKKNVTK